MRRTITLKNKRTGKPETISQYGLETVGWGFCFFVANEAAAYKAAYVYRNNPHGAVVKYAPGAQKWVVTVFNEEAKSMGIDGAK